MTPRSRWITSLGALVLALGLVTVILSVKNIGLAPDTMPGVLLKMGRYKEAGRYDDAIAAGKTWVATHPDDGSNDQVFGQIAVLYLEKAAKKDRNADEYIAQAIAYRDKMLPVASDTSLGWYSIATLQDSALISEHVADLSDRQRCVQYRNAIKLLERRANWLRDKEVELSRQQGSRQDSFGHTSDDARKLLREDEEARTRIVGKQQAGRCQ